MYHFDFFIITFLLSLLFLMLRKAMLKLNAIQTYQKAEMVGDKEIAILAQWIAENGSHQEGDPNLDLLLEMDAIRSKVYEENRIKKSFGEAAVMANDAVIRKILEIE